MGWLEERRRAKLERLQNDELARLESKIGEYERDVAEKTNTIFQYQNVRQQDKEAFDRKTRQISELESDVRRLREEVTVYQASLEGEKQTHDNDVRALEEQVRRTIEEKERQIAGARQQAQNEIQSLRQAHAGEIKTQNSRHRVEIQQQVQSSRESEERIVAQHEKEKTYWQGQVRDLNAALASRDENDYKGSLIRVLGLPTKPDPKLREALGEVQRMVDQLGRLEWKANPAIWTEHEIERHRGQQTLRIVRKAIVQDIVWAFLFQGIFCSPFRTFGEEGKKLEREWFEHCSQNPPSTDDKFPWPAPGAQAERWRYMTMKECREALTGRVSEFDARLRLRNGYMSSIDSLSATLKDELKKVVELSGEDMQLIDKMSRKAASMWLEFQMHRCRIVVDLTGTGLQSSSQKAAQLQRGSLALTVSPRLGRYGTVKGVELNSFTTIDGCSGESLTLS